MTGKTDTEVLRVKMDTKPGTLAGAIKGFIDEGKTVVLSCIGAGAVNQAVKGAAVARGFVGPQGKNLLLIPGFADVEIRGEERTAITFRVVID